MMPRIPRTEANGLRAFIRSLPKLWGGNSQLTFFQNYFITFLPLEGFLAHFHRFFNNAAHSVTRLRVPLFLAVLLPIGELKGLEDTYWQGYLDARRVGQVNNVNAYIGFLATPSSTETSVALRQRKDALTYFIATGGKYGFSDQKATPEEIEDWHKAFTFVALMQETLDPNVSLNFMEMRRRFGRSEEDERVSTHVRLAQEWVTTTRMRLCQFAHGGSSKIQTLYQREYMPHVGLVKGYPTSSENWSSTLKAFIQTYDRARDEQVKRLHGRLQGVLGSSHTLAPVKGTGGGDDIATFHHCVTVCCQPSVHARLDKGVMAVRQADGTVAVKGGRLKGRRALSLSRLQTQEAFMEALGQCSLIREIFYV